MKTKLLIISLILAIGSGVSQTEIHDGVSTSATYKNLRANSRSLFNAENTIYFLKADAKKKFLQVHPGDSFNLQSIQNLDPTKGQCNLINTPLISEQKIGFLSQSLYKKKLITEYNEFDLKSKSFLPPLEISNSDFVPKIYISDKQNYFVEVTNNKKENYGMIIGEKKYTHEKVKLNFTVYNSNIEKIWSDSITFEFDDSQYQLNSIKINDNGEIFMFCTIYHNEKRELYNKDKEKTADQITYYITKNGATQFDLSILSDFNRTSSFYFVSDKEGHNYMAGLYQDNEDVAINYQGFFLSKIVNGNLQKAIVYPFEKDVIDNYVKLGKEQTAITPYSGTANLSIKNIEFGDDQSVTVFFNQRYSYEKRTKDSYVTVYIDQNVFVSHAKLDESEAWTVKLPKLQQGYSLESELGYFETYTPEYTYLLYIDHKDNLSLSKDESPHLHYYGRGGFLMVCRIDNKSGEIEKKQLFDLTEFKPEIHFISFDRFLTFDNKVVFEAFINSKNDILITIDYEKVF